MLDEADTVIIGAGSGLSTAAGYTYSGERFNTYFSDFAEKYKIQDRSILIDGDIREAVADLLY